MTIKQHGGVFGRNPKFNNVEAESLSIAGNAVPDASTILVDSDIGSTVQGYDADTAKYDDATANFTGTLQNGGSNVLVDTDIGSTVQGYDADTAKLDVAQTFTAAQTFNENIVMANTKGIDFSATGNSSGTTTSELFDDYEEGEWTPTYAPQTGSFTSLTLKNNQGTYVKIGNKVYLEGRISVDGDAGTDLTGASGRVSIQGLPFTGQFHSSSNGYAGGASLTSTQSNWGISGSTGPQLGEVGGSKIRLLFIDDTVANRTRYIDVSDMTTATSTRNSFNFIAQYTVA